MGEGGGTFEPVRMSKIEQYRNRRISNDPPSLKLRRTRGILNVEGLRTKMIFDSGQLLGRGLDNVQFSIFNNQCSREREQANPESLESRPKAEREGQNVE